MNVVALLEAQARARPNAPALIDAGTADHPMSFAELDARAARASSMLKAHGLRANDIVLVLHYPTAELYVALVAILRAGAVVMTVELAAGRRLMTAACEIARPKAILASRSAWMLCLTMPTLRRVPLAITTGWFPGAISFRRTGGHEPVASEPRDYGDSALITFTSGSTGLPKGAVRSHGALLAQHDALRDIAAAEGDVDLVSLPIVVLSNLAAGAYSVLPDADLRRPGKIDPAPVLAQIARHRVSRITAPPAFLSRLVDGGTDGKPPMPAIQRILTGGGPVFPDLIERLTRAAPSADVVSAYGSTEAEPIAHVSHREVSQQDLDAMRNGAGLLAGPPAGNTRLRIVRPAPGPMSPPWLEENTLPMGQPGEIVVTGAHVLRGYLHGRGDEETKVRLRDDIWHRTGDLGSLDTQGRLWLLGRVDAAIHDARGVLYPFAVECAARQVIASHAAAVVANDGQRVLVVHPRDSAAQTPESVRDALGWAQLDRVLFAPDIPLDRRHNSKVDYTRLEVWVRKVMRVSS